MKLAVFAYTRRGQETARRILAALPEAEKRAYTPERLAGEGFCAIGPDCYAAAFRESDALVFVGAAGIAVRAIAPFVRSKTTDPAVVCMDERAAFVIPLLSGHIGGANALGRRLAAALGAVCAVTTATDVNGRFSVDRWAAENGYILDDLPAAKAVSAAILERDVPLLCDLPIASALPPGLVPGNSGKVGVYIGWEKKTPFDTTLRLIPRALHLGLGCRRGTGAERVRRTVNAVLDAHGIDPRAIRCAASVDLKASEPGLLEYCAGEKLPVSFYSAEALRAVPGEFASSAFVERVAGVDNVCERAAMLGAERLIVKKTAVEGVTVALGAEHVEVRFA